jgi:DNA-binding transcriptional regulator YiaG
MRKPESKRFVARLLEDLGWSQEQLAVELGVSWHTVDKWVKGINTPKGGNWICLQILRNNFDEHGVKSVSLQHANA